jgi:hypothetical protein
LWIVAPITRAVDDKTAQSLLGDSFRRQLKFDGNYSAVSFICSKTDDISITEAIEGLDLGEELGEKCDKAEYMKAQIRSLKTELVGFKDDKYGLGDAVDRCAKKLDKWDELLCAIQNGKTVYAPDENTKKRKRASKSNRSRKTRFSANSDDEDGFEPTDSQYGSSSDKENSSRPKDQEPLTEEEATEAIAALKARKESIRTDRKIVDKKIHDKERELARVKMARQLIMSEVLTRCIKARNEYSRRAISSDFAMGVKE